MGDQAGLAYSAAAIQHQEAGLLASQEFIELLEFAASIDKSHRSDRPFTNNRARIIIVYSLLIVKAIDDTYGNAGASVHRTNDRPSRAQTPIRGDPRLAWPRAGAGY